MINIPDDESSKGWSKRAKETQYKAYTKKVMIKLPLLLPKSKSSNQLFIEKSTSQSDDKLRNGKKMKLEKLKISSSSCEFTVLRKKEKMVDQFVIDKDKYYSIKKVGARSKNKSSLLLKYYKNVYKKNSNKNNKLSFSIYENSSLFCEGKHNFLPSNLPKLKIKNYQLL